MPKLLANPFSATIGVSSAPLVPTAEHRVGLILSPALTNRFAVASGKAAVLDTDLTILPGGPQLVLDYEEIGDAIRQGLNAIAAAAGTIVNGWDILLAP